MTTISTYTLQGSNWVEDELEIRFTKRSYGGWIVRRADNGRELGWLTPVDFRDTRKGWEARAASSAFRGDSIDDQGHILDEVPLYLFNGVNTVSAEPVGYGDTREEAASELISRLRKNHAPALGYGRHHAVTPYQTTR